MSAPQEKPDPTEEVFGKLTDDEIQFVKDCMSKSTWYSAVPCATMAMATTHWLISKGFLTTSTRFRSIPKVAFAGLMGYLMGKSSYVLVCRGELNLRRGNTFDDINQRGLEQLRPRKPLTRRIDPNRPLPSYSLESTMPEPPSGVYSGEFNSSVEVPFGSSMSESSTTGISDDTVLEPQYEDEPAKPPPMTYEELRNKNRGVQDVSKPRTEPKPTPIKAPRIEVKKNQYGDVWEE